MTTMNKQFTQDQLDAIYDSVVYLLETNEEDYLSQLDENGEEAVKHHIYLSALTAFDALNKETV
jgi:hypothetical protein